MASQNWMLIGYQDCWLGNDGSDSKYSKLNHNQFWLQEVAINHNWFEGLVLKLGWKWTPNSRLWFFGIEIKGLVFRWIGNWNQTRLLKKVNYVFMILKFGGFDVLGHGSRNESFFFLFISHSPYFLLKLYPLFFNFTSPQALLLSPNWKLTFGKLFRKQPPTSSWWLFSHCYLS